MGVQEEQKSRLGLWANGSMQNSYISILPREAMKGMAGFKKESTYHIHRASVEVPEGLLEQVFPGFNSVLHTQSKNQTVI